MSEAENLLNTLDDVVIATPDPAAEEHIVIDSNRNVYVPEALRRIAVQYDHNIETVTFDCPRYWDGIDMSEMKVYINYMRSDGKVGQYHAETVTIDETDANIIHFDWIISRNVTEANGSLSFLVCIKTTDDEGNEVNHWNTELNREMAVSEGLEADETILNSYPDIITQLLIRMVNVETDNTTTRNYLDTEMAATLAAVDAKNNETKQYVNAEVENAITYANNKADEMKADWDRTVENVELIADTLPEIDEMSIDYVVEQKIVDYSYTNTAGTRYYYRKWNSGIAEVWGTANVIGPTNGNEFRGAFISPVTFISTTTMGGHEFDQPVINATIKHNINNSGIASNHWTIGASMDHGQNDDDNSYSRFEISVYSSENNSDNPITDTTIQIEVYISILGRWK